MERWAVDIHRVSSFDELRSLLNSEQDFARMMSWATDIHRAAPLDA